MGILTALFRPVNRSADGTVSALHAARLRRASDINGLIILYLRSVIGGSHFDPHSGRIYDSCPQPWSRNGWRSHPLTVREGRALNRVMMRRQGGPFQFHNHRWHIVGGLKSGLAWLEANPITVAGILRHYPDWNPSVTHFSARAPRIPTRRSYLRTVG